MGFMYSEIPIDVLQNRKTISQEEFNEQQRILELEEKDRQRFVKDITALMREFQSYGMSADAAAQLAGIFYGDPEIRKRRNNRGKGKK